MKPSKEGLKDRSGFVQIILHELIVNSLTFIPFLMNTFYTFVPLSQISQFHNFNSFKLGYFALEMEKLHEEAVKCRKGKKEKKSSSFF